MNNLTDFQQQYLEMMLAEELEELDKNADTISSFKSFMSQKGIVLDKENFKYVQTIGIVAIYPNIISHLHQNLRPDKEGLFDYIDLCRNFKKERLMKGYLTAENFMLMGHPYFRRGFNEVNNYAPRFIDLFWDFESENIDTYIALDFDRVRINVNRSSYMELDTWFGAHFNKNIEAISDGNVKLRPPLYLDSFLLTSFFKDVYTLDIKWATKDGIKSFQAEEFKNECIKISKNGIEYYPVRYIHAEYDLKNEHFRHFDGAIHFYNETEYFKRRDSDFDHNRKNANHIKTISQKLFKMNGIINIDTWMLFTSHFLTGNPLVFEYFEGQYPQHVTKMLEKIKLERNGETSY